MVSPCSRSWCVLTDFSSQSWKYMISAVLICFMLERQEMVRAFSRAWANTGKRMAARMAMMAITTSSSMSVKPRGEALGLRRWALGTTGDDARWETAGAGLASDRVQTDMDTSWFENAASE